MPTGGMFIPKHVELCEHLRAHEKDMSKSDSLDPILVAMISKLKLYLDKALGFKTLVMATILHPDFCLRFLANFFKKDIHNVH